MRCGAHLLLIGLAALASAGSAGAAGAEELYPFPGQSDRPTVKDHVRRGRRARDAGRWNEAYAAYQAALEAATPTSSTERERAELAGELGLCALALRKYREAAEHLARSLEQREALPVAQQKRFEQGLRSATLHVATLYLAVDPPDAEVLIDGERLGHTARTYRLFLEPGQRMVRARAPGREEAFHSFSAVAKTEYNVTMQLPRTAVSSEKEGAPGSPKEAPLAPSPPAAERARPLSRWVLWPETARIGGIAATTATAAAGAVFLLRAHVVHRNLREEDVVRRAQGWTSYTCREASAPAECADIRDQVKERSLFATLGKVSLATSAVFGVVTAASWFTEVAVSGAAPRAAGVRVVPVATGERTGVLLEGAS